MLGSAIVVIKVTDAATWDSGCPPNKRSAVGALERLAHVPLAAEAAYCAFKRALPYLVQSQLQFNCVTESAWCQQLSWGGPYGSELSF